MKTDDRLDQQNRPSIDGQIWNLMLDANRCHRYYAELAGRYRTHGMWLNITVVLGSLIAGTLLLLDVPSWISAISFFSVAVITIWDVFYQPLRKSADARNVSRQCDEISIASKRLWRGQDSFNELERAIELETRLSNITHAELTIDHDLNERCEKDAQRDAANEFGASVDQYGTSASPEYSSA